MKNDWSDMPPEMLEEIKEIRDNLEPGGKGQSRNTMENCVIVLENDPLLKGKAPSARISLQTGPAS